MVESCEHSLDKNRTHCVKCGVKVVSKKFTDIDDLPPGEEGKVLQSNFKGDFKTHWEEPQDWESEWRLNRQTTILTKESKPDNQVIDMGAIEKRDIDFISDLLKREREQARKEERERLMNLFKSANYRK